MRFAALACLAFLSACAGTPDTTPVNHRIVAMPQQPVVELGVDGDAIALALSGGGARAASFSYGALLQLRDMKDVSGKRLIDRVALVTAVSGGAITATYFGQHGADGLDGFRAVGLDEDWQSTLHTSFAAPNNWARLLQGGLNGPDRLAEWLDDKIFKDGRMRDLPTRPRIIINATDLYTGAPFAFAAPYFQAVCSDLSDVRLADAVAASMAVPLAFRPIILETFPKDCPTPLPTWVDEAAKDRTRPMLLRETARAFQLYRDPERMKYVHLTDGGVADNFGLSSLITIRHASQTPYGPFSPRDAVKIRRMTFLVVNAEATAAGDWPREAKGPDGMSLVDAAMTVSINAAKRVAADAFAGTMAEWERDLIEYRCSLPKEEAERLGAGPGWNCKDVKFTLDIISFRDLPDDEFRELGGLPTVVSLPKEQVDRLIAGGRHAIESNEAVRALTR